MKCANSECCNETLYLRSGGIFEVDFLGGTDHAGEGQNMQRRVIWLCDTCSGRFAVETWRPPGEQMRPSRRLFNGTSRARRPAPAEIWS